LECVGTAEKRHPEEQSGDALAQQDRRMTPIGLLPELKPGTEFAPGVSFFRREWGRTSHGDRLHSTARRELRNIVEPPIPSRQGACRPVRHEIPLADRTTGGFIEQEDHLGLQLVNI
jgi:hypothetical protein